MSRRVHHRGMRCRPHELNHGPPWMGEKVNGYHLIVDYTTLVTFGTYGEETTSIALLSVPANAAFSRVADTFELLQ